MQYKTYGAVKEKVQTDLDLLDELFISSDEILGYAQDAVDVCESQIHKFDAQDEYFLASEPIPFVRGRQEYALPTRIYGNKIKRIIFQNGSEIYELQRLKRSNRFDEVAYRTQYGESQEYKYMIVNNSAKAGPRLRIWPPARETAAVVSTTGAPVLDSLDVTVADATGVGANYFVEGTGIEPGTFVQSVSGNVVTLSTPATASGSPITLTFTQPLAVCWFIRNANRPGVDADLIDIPEFVQFVEQFMKVCCMKKEGHPNYSEEKARLDELREEMASTLAEMTPDQDDQIEVDDSIYKEMS